MYGFVERRISEAVERGEFDNLPGAGRPLDLSENPYVAPEWRLAFKILKDHAIVPEFVERRKEIEAIREGMKRCSSRLLYRELLERLSTCIEALNRSLARENQFVRNGLQLPPVDVEAELRAFESRG